jgi:peptidyl-prolyl cis-trans isomerase C
MRLHRLPLCLTVALAAWLAVPHSSQAAMTAEEKARRGVVVAKIGSREITTGELEDRIAQVPRYQLATFGSTPDTVRRGFLDQIIVPEALFAEEAHEEHIDERLPTAGRIARAEANAAVRVVRAELGPPTAIPMEDIRAYYEANRGRYDTPERYNVWRILCRSREEAVAVIEAARKDLTVNGFNALAREHSLDKATNQRGGNLGFLAADGTSNEAGLHADPAVAKAASSVRDGELVPQPVPEGQNFAVVWHRGTVPAVRRTLEEVLPQIRDTIWKQREDDAVKSRITQLRAKYLHEMNESLLNGIEISAADGAIQARHRPGQVPPMNPSQTLPR